MPNSAGIAPGTDYGEANVIAKLVKGSNFRRAADYLLRAGKVTPRVALLGGNMIGRDGRSLADEFRVGRELRPDVPRPVWHAMLALAPEQSLTTDAWTRAVRIFMSEMGLNPDRHQWCVVLHMDTRHEHVHVLASRVSVIDGLLAREMRGDFRLSHKAAAVAAAEVGLAPVVSSRYGPSKTPLGARR
jgi:hypothetical protein